MRHYSLLTLGRTLLSSVGVGLGKTIFQNQNKNFVYPKTGCITFLSSLKFSASLISVILIFIHLPLTGDWIARVRRCAPLLFLPFSVAICCGGCLLTAAVIRHSLVAPCSCLLLTHAEAFLNAEWDFLIAVVLLPVAVVGLFALCWLLYADGQLRILNLAPFSMGNTPAQ